MEGAPEFGAQFQRQLIRALVSDSGLRGLVQKYLATGQLGWTDPSALWGWQVIRGDEYPSFLKLETELSRLDDDDPAKVGGAFIIDRSSEDWREDEYTRDQIVEWARRQTFQLGFEESRAAWNAGDHNQAMDLMMARIEEINGLRLETADRGWFFEEFAERQHKRQFSQSSFSALPIGIEKYDQALGGGLSFGELEVPMAYSGIGKTFWCVQRGFVACRIRRRVLHIVLEGGRKKTEDRYEARFADTLYHRVKAGDIDAEVMSLMNREYQLLRQNLVIRGFGDLESWQASYNDILGEMQELRVSFGFVPHLVIIDYGDLMAAPGDSEYQRQKVGFRQLKALSDRIEFRGHEGYAVCSPTQAQRPDKKADVREHVLYPQQVADCYEKVRVADAVPSINRTEREKEYKLARVFLGKYRDNEDGLLVRVRTNYARGAFSDLSVKEEPDPPPPLEDD